MMRSVVLSSLCVFSLAFARLEAQVPLAELVAQLGGADVRARQPAYRQLLEEKSPAALSLLRKELPDFDPSAQNLGLSLLMAFPDPGREAVLRDLAKGKPSFLRLGAAVWLHQRGDQNAVRHIIACLGDPGPPPALSHMLGRLFNVKDPGVLEALQQHLRSESTTAELASLFRLLAQADARGAIPRVNELVTGKTLSADQSALCVTFLAVMGETQQRPALIAAILDGKSWNQLQQLLREANRLDQETLAAILAFAEEQKGHPLRTALELLVKFDYRPAVTKMLEWLNGDEGERAKEALDALTSMGETVSPDKLRTLLTSDVEKLRIAAADALRRVDDPSGLPHLIELIERGSVTKSEATQVLAKYRDPRVVPVLLTLLDDADATVRMRAFGALPPLFQSLFPYRRFDFNATGYAHGAPLDVRRAAIATMQQWWSENSKRLKGAPAPK